MKQITTTGAVDYPVGKCVDGTCKPSAGRDIHKTDSPSRSIPIHGGECFCGEIRYRIEGEPVIQLYCFCEDCHSIAGADGYHSGFLVRESDFQLLGGNPATYEALSSEGRIIKRHYCGKCGTELWAETDLGLLSVSTATFDNPGAFGSTRKVFVQDAPDWARALKIPAQRQDSAGGERLDDGDDDNFTPPVLDLQFEPGPGIPQARDDEDDTDLDFENIELSPDPTLRDRVGEDDGDDTDTDIDIDIDIDIEIDTDIACNGVDLQIEPASQNQAGQSGEDDTDLDYEDIDKGDRHSLSNLGRRSGFPDCRR